MRYYLVCTYVPTEETEIFPLRAKKFQVGRGRKSSPTELALPFDASLSRNHFGAQLDGSQLKIFRSQGKVPLMVDGVAQDKFALEAGQSFRSAHTLFQFVAQQQAGEGPAPPEFKASTFTLSFEQLCKVGQSKRFFELLLRLSQWNLIGLTPEQIFPRFLEELAQATPEVAALLVAHVPDDEDSLELVEKFHYQRGPLRLQPSRVLADKAIKAGEPVFHFLNNSDRAQGPTPTMVLGINWMMAAPIPSQTGRLLLFAGGIDVEEGTLHGQQGRAMVAWLSHWLGQHLRSAQKIAQLEDVLSELVGGPLASWGEVAPEAEGGEDPQEQERPEENKDLVENSNFAIPESQDADLDELTQLPGRYAFFERARAVLERAAQQGRPFTLIVVGVDGLRDFNRRHGFRQGDRLLRHLGQVVGAALRPDQLLGRLGGSKFAIVTGQTREVAWLLADLLRREVESKFLDGDEELRATLSLGLGGGALAESQSFIEALSDAENALAEAKRDGGNQVRAHEIS